MTTPKICLQCGRPFEAKFKLVGYCSKRCRNVRRLEYFRDYMRKRRQTPEGRRYHREWMARKRFDEDYRERERERDRRYRRKARR